MAEASNTKVRVTPDIIAREGLRILKNNIVFPKLFSSDHKREFKKVGDIVRVRKPHKFKSGLGADISSSMNNLQASTVNVKLDKQRHIPWEWSSVDLTLRVDQFSQEYLVPAMSQLANDIDRDCAAIYKTVWNAVGSAGNPPSNFKSLGSTAALLDKLAVPDDGNRRLVLNPDANWELADGLKGFYLQKEVGKIYHKGYLGEVATMKIFGSQNIYQHTAAAHTGTPLVARQTDIGAGDGTMTYITASDTSLTSTLYTDGWTASTDGVAEGDIFTIEGVYSVNPKTRETTGALQQFVVKSAVTADESGYATLTVSPAIVITGNYQTVSAAPASNAPIEVVDSHAANIAFHRDAFEIVWAPLEIPDGVNWSSVVIDPDTGISVRVIKFYDGVYDKQTIRLDVLYGIAANYPELACRMLG